MLAHAISAGVVNLMQSSLKQHASFGRFILFLHHHLMSNLLVRSIVHVKVGLNAESLVGDGAALRDVAGTVAVGILRM